MPMKNVIVFMADGMEMCECLITVDILRRAGINVTTASVMGRREVTSSHGVMITADTIAEDADYESTDMIVLPGGRTGTENLAASEVVRKQCRAFAAEKSGSDCMADQAGEASAAANEIQEVRTSGKYVAEPMDGAMSDRNAIKYVAAICAAPSVLAGLGLLDGKHATCHPDFAGRMAGAALTGESVTTDGNIITGQGLGATFDFAFRLVSLLAGDEAVNRIRESICCHS